MIRREYSERDFSELVDRLVAGEDVQVDPAEEADFRTALEFARQMAAAAPVPRTRLKSDLKPRLRRELAEREAKKAAGGGNRFLGLLRRPVWQAAVAAVFVITVVTTLWATGVFTREPGGIAPPGTILAVAGDTSKNAYAAGEPVEISLSVKNVTNDALTLERFPPNLSLMNADTREAVYTFSRGGSTVTLAPGQETRFTTTWDQTDSRGARASPGSYFVELEDLEYQGEPLRLTFVGVVSFDITPE
jgi:hypothetical protein